MVDFAGGEGPCRLSVSPIRYVYRNGVQLQERRELSGDAGVGFCSPLATCQTHNFRHGL